VGELKLLEVTDLNTMTSVPQMYRGEELVVVPAVADRSRLTRHPSDPSDRPPVPTPAVGEPTVPGGPTPRAPVAGRCGHDQTAEAERRGPSAARHCPPGGPSPGLTDPGPTWPGARVVALTRRRHQAGRFLGRGAERAALTRAAGTVSRAG
jgi:hypothetical protein